MAGTPLHVFLRLFRTGRVVLASGSPRRKQLLAQIGLSFDIVESEFPEDLDKTQFASPADYAVENAKRKGMGSFLQMGFAMQAQPNNLSTTLVELVTDTSTDVVPPWLVIACDTVVVAEASSKSAAVQTTPVIFEKPVDETDALAMLQRMSGSWHHVVSGVWIALRMQSEPETRHATEKFSNRKLICYRQISFHETTRVKFSALSDAVMRGYVSCGEGFGKAGGYGIQGVGATLIERIDGDFYNVMGFPLNRFCRELARLLEECGSKKAA